MIENEYPFSGKVTRHPKSDSGGIQNLGPHPLFLRPQNTNLLELWDIVADRLYKIRNCLNSGGGCLPPIRPVRPPLDTAGMLINAAAQGVDLGSVLGDLQAPCRPTGSVTCTRGPWSCATSARPSAQRFYPALEKNDGEALAVMRTVHEVEILDLMHRVKLRQLDEANAQVDALNASRNTAAQRYGYYQTLMGVSGGSAPAVGANIPLIPIPSQPSLDVLGIQLIPEEGLELTLSTAASVVQTVAAGIQALAIPLSAVPRSARMSNLLDRALP